MDVIPWKVCLTNGKMPDKHEVVKIMRYSNLYKIESEKTFYRRAQTIMSWIKWILELTRL